MKHIALLVVIGFSLSALGADTNKTLTKEPARKRMAKRTTIKSRAMASSSMEEVNVSRPTDLDFFGGLGLSLVDGSAGLGLGAGLAKRVSNRYPIYLGGELGFSFWSRSVTSLSSISYKAIHMLPTAYYVFEVSDSPRLHPYAGVSMGLAFLFASANAQGLTGVQTELASDSKVAFEMAFRSGVNFDVDRDITLGPELRLGILDSAFLFSILGNVTVAL